jgi:hypothetical protein
MPTTMQPGVVTFEVTFRIPADEIVRLLSPEQRSTFMAGIARLLSEQAIPAEGEAETRIPPPAPPGAEPPKERGRVRVTVPKERPAAVTCEKCAAVLLVGRKGPLPRFCRAHLKDHSRKLPPAHAIDVEPLENVPAPPAPVDPRRAEVQRRIGSMLALDQGDPRAQSTLLKQFDERRAPRR